MKSLEKLTQSLLEYKAIFEADELPHTKELLQIEQSLRQIARTQVLIGEPTANFKATFNPINIGWFTQLIELQTLIKLLEDYYYNNEIQEDISPLQKQAKIVFLTNKVYQADIDFLFQLIKSKKPAEDIAKDLAHISTKEVQAILNFYQKQAKNCLKKSKKATRKCIARYQNFSDWQGILQKEKTALTLEEKTQFLDSYQQTEDEFLKEHFRGYYLDLK